MKAAQTQHQRLIPPEMRRSNMAGQQIKPHKAKDHEQICQETALRPVAIACYQVQEVGKHPRTELAAALSKRCILRFYHLKPEHFTLEDIGPVSKTGGLFIQSLSLKCHNQLPVRSHGYPVVSVQT